jgi:recombination protein RecA
MQKETVGGEEIVIASETQVEVKKNKTSPPFRKAKFFITFGKGIDPTASIFDAALKRKINEKRGSWFSYKGEMIAQGRMGCLTVLSEGGSLFDAVRKDVEIAMANRVPVKAEGVAQESQGEQDDAIDVQDVKPKQKRGVKRPAGILTAEDEETGEIEVEVTDV